MQVLHHRAKFAACVSAAVLGALVVVSLGTGPKQANGSATYESDVVSRVLPSSSTSVDGSAPSEGARLEISLGDEAVTATKADPYFTMEIQWRAALAAAVIAESNGTLTSFRVSDDQGLLDDRFSGTQIFRETPDAPLLSEEMPSLDTVTAEAAADQLEQNVSTLESGAPGTVDNARIERVTIDPAAGAEAFIVVIESSLPPERLQEEMGNYVGGLSTGLVGGDDEAVDGLGILIVNNGAPVLGNFVAARAGLTQFQLDDSVKMPQALVPTLEFKNLTGGPGTRSTVFSTTFRIPDRDGQGD